MFKVTTSAFVSALARVVPLCRPTSPDFLSVSLSGKDGALHLHTQNEDMAVRVTVPGEGSLTARLPASRLLSVAREMIGDSLEFAPSKKSAFVIRSAKFESVLSAAPQPAVSAAVQLAAIKVDVRLAFSDLRDALRATVFAVADDETRVALIGVHVVVGEGGLDFVATDGRRLAVIHVKAETVKGAGERFTIPRAAVNLALKAFAGEEGKVWMRTDGARFALESETTDFRGKLSDSVYPNWERVIPASSDLPIHFTVSREALAASVSRSAIIDCSRVNMDIGAEAIRLSTAQKEVGESEDTVAITRNGKKDRLLTAFGPTYLTEALHAVHADELEFALGDRTPLVMRAGDWRYVVMPLAPMTAAK